MAQDRSPSRMTDAAAGYRTPRRPGQPGEENEQRHGPSPLSANATGPHAPYEADDAEGLAAAKHVRESFTADEAARPLEQRGLQSENITIVDGKSRVR